MFLVKIFHLIFKVMKSALLLTIMAAILFIAYRGNQPMSVLQAPEGMTYWQFMADRLDAAKSVQPSRCGWGMMLSLAAIGPIYSVVYTSVGINPEGSLRKSLLQIRIFLRTLTTQSGTKSRISGGKPLSDCPGQCLESRQHMDVNSGLSNLLSIRNSTSINQKTGLTHHF
jgi:hypothetical protein